MNENDRAIVGLVMVGHALVHTYELSIPILVGIWLAEFSTTATTIGIAVTIGTAFFGLGALPSGILADRYGSQRLIALCLLGMGGSFVVLGRVDTIIGVTISLAIWGIAASVYHPSGLSLISKGVTERGTAFAFHGMAGNFGIAIGPLVTALLLIILDWRMAVTVLAIPAVFAALWALSVEIAEASAVEIHERNRQSSDNTDRGPPQGGNLGGGSVDHQPPGQDESQQHRITSTADDSSTTAAREETASESVTTTAEFFAVSRTLFASTFIVVFAILILSGLYYRGVTTFLPESLAAIPVLGPVTLGATTLEPSRFVYAGLLMVGMAGQYMGGKLTDRMSTEWGLMGGFGALTIVTILFIPAMAAQLPVLLVVAGLLGFFLFVLQPMYQSMVAEYSPPETRGLTYGYTYLGVFGIGAIGAVLAGAVLTHGSTLSLFGMLAGFGLLGFTCSGYLAVRQP